GAWPLILYSRTLLPTYLIKEQRRQIHVKTSYLIYLFTLSLQVPHKVHTGFTVPANSRTLESTHASAVLSMPSKIGRAFTCVRLRSPVRIANFSISSMHSYQPRQSKTMPPYTPSLENGTVSSLYKQ